MTIVPNNNGKPQYIPDGTFAVVYSDATNFYFFTTKLEAQNYLATLPTQPDSTSLSAIKTIIQTAQSAVGIKYDALTAAQVRALFAVDLYMKGALDPTTLKIKPLNQWVNK